MKNVAKCGKKKEKDRFRNKVLATPVLVGYPRLQVGRGARHEGKMSQKGKFVQKQVKLQCQWERRRVIEIPQRHLSLETSNFGVVVGESGDKSGEEKGFP